MEKDRLQITKESGFTYSIVAICQLIISFTFSIIIVASLGNQAGDFTSSDIYKMMSFILGALIVVTALILSILKHKENYLKLLQKPKFEVVPMVSMLLITFGFMFGLSEVNVWFVSLLESAGLTVPSATLPSFSPVYFILTILFVCIIPSICEEIIFRGVVLNGLSGCKEIYVILINGLLFSIFHTSPSQTIYQFIVGALYALIALRSRSVYPTIISHFINNTFVILNYYFFNISLQGTTKIIVTIVALMALVVGVLLLIFKTKKQDEVKTQGQGKAFIKGSIWGIVVSIVLWITNLI